MMKIYSLIMGWIVLCSLPLFVNGQTCSGFSASCAAYESRCAATGSIKINATGGSGNYKYKVTGVVSTSFTSTDSITGLPAGAYTVTVSDINTGCTLNIAGVVVPGTYGDPRFTLNVQDVSCDNGNNGRITLATLSNGRGPFRYSIIAPSTMGVGTSNGTGTFNGLVAGNYTIRLMDSCGGIQTRIATINNYTWRIDSAVFTKISCDSAVGYIRVSDSRGNVSTITPINGMTYGIVRSPGDTIWSNSSSFRFYLGTSNSFEAIVKDACGIIKKFPVRVSFRVSVNNNVNIYGQTCSTFSAAVTGLVNFFNPNFCLLDSNGIQISCNTTGVFAGLNYGSYCIQSHDACTDTVITRCFAPTPPPIGIGAAVRISNKTCNDFTAAITGQYGLTNPQYCLFDSAAVQINCNATGVFNNLAYGSYCIVVKDGCRDTSITRCFTARKSQPVLPANIYPGYYTCNNFGVNITGDSVNSPRYCLYDTTGLLITCNSTGVFDSIGYGSYCIEMYDSCYDTTITRCLSVAGPVFNGGISSQVQNKACSTFTAIINASGWINPNYCLYKSDSTLVSCNSTGVFDSLQYGSYFISVRNACPDTTITHYFSAYPPLPSLGANVSLSNRTCVTFSAAIQGGQNLNNPTYCLYDNVDSLVSCNSTGSFPNIVYGNYCIRMRDGCYDTTISRCFTAAPQPVDVRVTARKSCNYGFARFSISIAGGVLPYSIQIIKPNGDIHFTGTYNSGSISIDNIPGIAAELNYTIIVTDNCGLMDTTTTNAVPSYISHSASVIPLCPSSTWTNGSGTIVTAASANTGSLTVRIIKKDNVTLSPSISPSNVTGINYSFYNQGPGQYIIRYRPNDNCNQYFYDTVTVPVYQYPGLERSSAYQCDQSGFSIGAVVSNGVGPFQYEIIGSTPATPSIVAPPQSNPVFSINNGSTYSLVRLRVVDACGNASLEDASILPLSNNGITSDFNCFQLYTTLRVDTFYNSTYAWYRKHTEGGTDSVFVGNGLNVYFPNVTPADTGLYVCHIVVNGGCIKRTYYYRLDGSCYHYLPVTLRSFGGAFAGTKVALEWKADPRADFKRFEIERENNRQVFETIGRIEIPATGLEDLPYRYLDATANPVINYYRLKMVRYNGKAEYSNIIRVTRTQSNPAIQVFPNPAEDYFYIETGAITGHRLTVNLFTLTGSIVVSSQFDKTAGSVLKISRPALATPGLYILKIADAETGNEYVFKLVFRQ